MTRKASRPVRQLRPLNLPKVIRVWADEAGLPAALEWKGRRIRVQAIQECWRIDDEWWRSPVSRRYVRLLLDGGAMVTVYHDLEEGRWYTQDG